VTKTHLKPCPFCGSQAEVRVDYIDFPSVACDTCNIGFFRRGGEGLVDAWNRRYVLNSDGPREAAILTTLCDAEDTLGEAVRWIARLETELARVTAELSGVDCDRANLEHRLEAKQSECLHETAKRLALESTFGMRGETLLAYGDAFARIAGLLDVPIAGLPPAEAGPRLVSAVGAARTLVQENGLLRARVADLERERGK
jgi:hypothetical protein